MATTRGPMNSLRASGSIGDAINYTPTKRGTSIRKKRRTQPAPSGHQVATQAMMRFLQNAWRSLTNDQLNSWPNAPGASVASAYHAYLSYNMARWATFNLPSAAYPANLTGPAATFGGLSLFPRPRSILAQISAAPPVENWGWILHRSTTAGFTPGRENAIAVIPAPNQILLYHLDTPLPFCPHYYRVMGFTFTARFSNYSAQKTATPLD